MDFLNYQLTDPIVLTICAFIGGLLSGYISWKHLGASKTMTLTVMVLPAVVAAALLSINGSLGAGIAILGVFGLVRFRSMPGSGTDIVSVFYAMVIGLMMSTGFVITAAVLSLVLAAGILLAVWITNKTPAKYNLHIVVPEDTQDLGIFTDILSKYANNVTLDRIRTTNMGSMYELVYTLEPHEGETGKMLDEIRVHNHNLNVALGIARPENSL